MRILFVTNSLEVGGIETNLVLLVHALAADRHEPIVAARPGALSAEVEAAGGRTHALRMRWREPRAVAADVRALRRILRAETPDVVHVFSAASNTLVRAALFGSRAQPPVVSSVMGLKHHPGERDLTTLARTSLVVAGADRVLLIAPSIAAMARRVPFHASRMVEAPVVGVDVPGLQRDAAGVDRGTYRRSIGVPPDTFLISTIGALAPRKSHELFVRAAAHTLEREPGTHFVIAGEGGLRPHLEHEIRRLGVAEHVHLLGVRRDVGALLAASDVYVKPGVVEGFVGITVLEAQAVGTPVVAFTTVDVQLAIEHERTGLLVPPGDSAALGAAIAALLADPDRRERIARAAEEHVGETFGIAGIARRLVETYRTLVAASDR
jgi:glycosyltransferase involved in cell wall biosynthesis